MKSNKLSKRELQLLEYLAINGIASFQELLDNVWGPYYDIRILRNTVMSLRRKLLYQIETVPNYGYKLSQRQ